jgi:hypothetical protein
VPSPRAVLPRAAAAAVLAAAALAACSTEGEDPTLPLACEAGPEAVERALVAAPGPVRIEGEVRLSECFVRKASAGDNQVVGGTLLAVAGRLADRAGADQRAALRLGYLIGAARRGAGRTQGIHAELLRRP